jgi:sensor histidine kinase YesM
MANEFRRQQFFLDKNVQTAITWRIAGYWCFFLITTVNLVFFWRVFTGPTATLPEIIEELVERFYPALFASVALLPLVLFDAIRMSHRFVGPVYRLRAAMREIAAGRRTRQVKFRTNDYWQEMADEFNAVTAKIPQEDVRPVDVEEAAAR